MMQRLRDLAQRNQRLIVAAQYLVGASTFLIPLRATNYEIYTEASYSLSQLIAFFNNMLLRDGTVGGGSSSSGSGSSTSGAHINLQYVLWFLTRIVSHIEVFLEKFSLAFWGEEARRLLVLVIELAKATSRLILLLRRSHRGALGSEDRGPTMLLNWAREYPDGDDVSQSMDLVHYMEHYQKSHEDAARRQRQRLASRRDLSLGEVYGDYTTPRKNPRDDFDGDELSLLIRHRSPARSSRAQGDNELASREDADELVFIGRRSGVVLISPPSAGNVSTTTPRLLHGGGASRPDAMATITPKRWDNTWDDDGLSEGFSLGNAVTPALMAGVSVKTSVSGVPSGGEGNDVVENEGSTDADSFESSSGGGSGNKPILASPSHKSSRNSSPDGVLLPADEAFFGAATSPAREPPQGLKAEPEQRRKGWVVWTLEGSEDRDLHLGKAAVHSPIRSSDSGIASSSSGSGSIVQAIEQNEASDSGQTAVVSNNSRVDNQDNGGFPFSAEQALLVAELLYILRPVIYAWALHYVARRQRSRKCGGEAVDPVAEGGAEQVELRQPHMEDAIAWAISLMVEVASVQLTAIALQQTQQKAARMAAAVLAAEAIETDDHPPSSHLRQLRVQQHAFDRELSRRRVALFYYLIRSPVFSRATLPMLQSAAQLLRYIPIINALPGHAISMLTYLHRSHFRSAASSSA